MVTDTEKEKIKEEAKHILDKFAKSLEAVKLKEKSLKTPVSGFRKEGASESSPQEFREMLFSNAPKTEGDCIIAEKKKW